MDMKYPEYQEDSTACESIERNILLTNLHRLQWLLLGTIVLMALILACSYLLRDRAIEDLGSIGPFYTLIIFRGLWIGIDLLAFFMIRRLLVHKQEQTTFWHDIAETGSILLNMLFVVAILNIGYSYNPSLEVLYIALFALASVIRLNLIKTIVVIGLPCLLLLLTLLGRSVAGVVHISNIISLIAITILAMVIFRLMFLSRVRELTQQLTIERQLAEMENLANADGLTQLANRRRLDEHLEMEWRRSLREQSALAVIMIDIDLFKSFNDLYGHLAGDDCLQAVARAIDRHAKRAGEISARYGGEEFSVLLPGTDLACAAKIAENIRQEIFAMGRLHAGSPEECVTVSLGVATNQSVIVASGAELLQCADQALYRAKAAGRNRVALADCQRNNS